MPKEKQKMRINLDETKPLSCNAVSTIPVEYNAMFAAKSNLQNDTKRQDDMCEIHICRSTAD